MLLKHLQPASEILLLFRVFEKPDTFHDFPNGYDTEIKTLGIDQVDGAAYARIALRMAQLRKWRCMIRSIRIGSCCAFTATKIFTTLLLTW